MNIIAVSGITYDGAGNQGSAGAGKSTVSERLAAEHGFVNIAFADAMKRICMEVFAFSHEQLFGPSESRNQPDKRYLRTKAGSLGTLDGTPSPPEDVYLTARHTLQTLGTEWGRGCYEDVWVALAMRHAERIATGRWVYSPSGGVLRSPTRACSTKVRTVFSDMRFRNEFEYVRRHGVKTLRVTRPVSQLYIDNAHKSENDLNDVPDSAFDYVIHGKGADVPDLHSKVDRLLHIIHATNPRHVVVSADGVVRLDGAE